MAVKIDKGKATSLLDLTPIIDVVFNLLIFFMVVTHFEEQDVELDVTLASASEARPLTATDEAVFVNINRDGRYTADGRPMNLDDLEAFIKQKQVDRPGSLSVKIRPDGASAVQPSISVLNLCQKLGVRDVSFAAQGEEP
jgi:biopolymer transport protein ExbD